MSDTQTPTQVDEQQNAATQPQQDPETGKYVYTFDSVDADGNTKQYRYLYTDGLDLARQIQESKVNGDRYIHEVKSGKRALTPAGERPNFKTVEAQAEEDKTRRAQWRKDLEDEIGAPLDGIKQRLQLADNLHQYTVMRNWAEEKQNDDGYVICQSNSALLLDFLNGNNPEKKPLEMANKKNLDLAFEELKDKLILSDGKSNGTTDSTSAPKNDATQQSSRPSTGVKPGLFEGARPTTNTSEQPLTTKRYREIDRMSLSEFKQLERTNRKEYDAFVKMKHGGK